MTGGLRPHPNSYGLLLKDRAAMIECEGSNRNASAMRTTKKLSFRGSPREPWESHKEENLRFCHADDHRSSLQPATGDLPLI